MYLQIYQLLPGNQALNINAVNNQPNNEGFSINNSSQDKLISVILIHQYIKEHYNNFIENQILFNSTKDFLLNILINYTNDSNINIFSNSEESLIIERICLSLSIILIIGCFTFWEQGIEDIINFSTNNIKHTYLIF